MPGWVVAEGGAGIECSMTGGLGGCVSSSESGGEGGSSFAHFLGKGSPETGGHFCSWCGLRGMRVWLRALAGQRG